MSDVNIDLSANGKKVVCLLSGGLDSPVAFYTLIKRGFIPIFVYFDNYPYTGETSKQKTIEMAKKLTEYIPEKVAKMYIVPQGFIMSIFLKNASKHFLKYTCIFCKRMMYRIAERVALMEGGYAIATGEILGEQASQTLNNLFVLHQVIKQYTVLRPLIAWDKEQVVEKAREIGTYEIAAHQATSCTLPPKKPAIKGHLEKILEIESMIDIDALIQTSLRETITLKITSNHHIAN